MKDLTLKGEVVIVTGGTAGIGKAIALSYAQHGAHVVIIGTHVQRGELAKEEIQREAQSESVEFVAVDVSKTPDVKEVIAGLVSRLGKVDVLVNNAGITRDKLLLRMEEEDWDSVMSVNVKSCYNLTKALARTMMKARKGKIINISSVIGLTGNAGQVNYAASKAAIIGLTKALAKELAPRNIQVNCIAPGFIETPMTEMLTQEQKKEILATIPLSRMGEAKEVAHLALFLGSYLSDYITGQVFVIDGGMVI